MRRDVQDPGISASEPGAEKGPGRYAPRLPPAQRREQLLDATLRIIAEQGYSAVSIEAVAREAGVSRPVVYGLFSDLGDLLTALLEREEQRAVGQLAEAVPVTLGDRDPDQVVVDAILAFLGAVSRNPVTWRVILLPVEGAPVALQERVQRSRSAIIEQVERLVAWGLERRGGPAGLDVELMARILVVLGEEAGRLVLTDPERFPPERHGRMAATLLAAISREA